MPSFSMRMRMRFDVDDAPDWGGEGQIELFDVPRLRKNATESSSWMKLYKHQIVCIKHEYASLKLFA